MVRGETVMVLEESYGIWCFVPIDASEGAKSKLSSRLLWRGNGRGMEGEWKRT